LRILTSIVISLLIPLCLAIPKVGNGQTPVTRTVSENTNASSGDLAHVTYLIGLPAAKTRTPGELRLDPEVLEFNSGKIHTAIHLNQFVAVNIGDERTEKGGIVGQMAGMAVPFGGGALVDLALQKSVDLLTVGYRDPHLGYHGAVFVLSARQALGLQKTILDKITPALPLPATPCSSIPPNSASVQVAPIEVSVVVLPVEYRVLLYEHLMTELHARRPSDTYFRAGDISTGPGCDSLTLHVTVDSFKKGNQVLRASTGPLGRFLGTTSISYRMTLNNVDGKTLLDSKRKKSNCRDSDSLNVARGVAKDISKRMVKALSKNQSDDQAL
jgi:hypothetical protein